MQPDEDCSCKFWVMYITSHGGSGARMLLAKLERMRRPDLDFMDMLTSSSLGWDTTYAELPPVLFFGYGHMHAICCALPRLFVLQDSSCRNSKRNQLKKLTTSGPSSRIQAQKCKFAEKELQSRPIEQLIIGTASKWSTRNSIVKRWQAYVEHSVWTLPEHMQQLK